VTRPKEERRIRRMLQDAVAPGRPAPLPPVLSRCFARCPKDGTRCRLDAEHTEFAHSKNPEVDKLNGWHRANAGLWKDDVFLTWRQYNRMVEEVAHAQEERPEGSQELAAEA